MHSRSFRLSSLVFLLLFMFIYGAATVCLALRDKVCCPAQSDPCPLISLQKAPRTEQVKTVKISLPDKGLPVSVVYGQEPVISLFYIPRSTAAVPVNHSLVALVNHPINAPPRV